MAMARQFFDAQKGATLGPSFSPAQIAPAQDLVSRQLPHIPTNPTTAPNLSDAWANVQRASSLPGPGNAFSSAAWASEFGSHVFSPGPVVQQTVSLTNGAFSIWPNSSNRSDVENSDTKPISGRKCLRDNGEPLRFQYDAPTLPSGL